MHLPPAAEHLALFPRLMSTGTWAGVFAAMVLAGCAKSDGSEPTQVVAKVGAQEITELQVNQSLERVAGLRPDQVAPMSRKVVSALVEQEMVLKKARESKVDQDQQVVQTVEQLKRDAIARAYLERVADGAAKPTDSEMSAYYDSHPLLFGRRRIYKFQEFLIPASASQQRAIEAEMLTIKSPAELDDYLKRHQITARVERTAEAAENIPMALLPRIAELKPGQGLLFPNADVLRILLMTDSSEAPHDLDQARPSIRAYLLGEHRRAAVAREMAALHAEAKVEYFGRFADLAHGAASAPAALATKQTDPAVAHSPSESPTASGVAASGASPGPIDISEAAAKSFR